MTALYIIGGILLLILLLLLVKIGVYFSCYGKRPEVAVKIAFFTLRFDLKDLKAEADEQAEEKAVKKKAEKKKDGKKEEKKPSPAIKDTFRVFKDGIMAFWAKYKRYARLERYIVKINLGTDDPAKTAVLYGGVATVAASLHAWALSVRKRSRRVKDIYTEVKPDFIAETTDAAAEVGFSLRVWQILSCAITLFGTYRKYKKLPPKVKKGDKKTELKEKGDGKDDKRQA